LREISALFLFSEVGMFPEWSNLGSISSASSLAWQAEASLREKYHYYYDGDMFKEHVPLESGTGTMRMDKRWSGSNLNLFQIA
jgi:hypothetical protein